jgi:hypothetical protein
MWEPWCLTTLWTSAACYRDSFTFLLPPASSSSLVSILYMLMEERSPVSSFYPQFSFSYFDRVHFPNILCFRTIYKLPSKGIWFISLCWLHVVKIPACFSHTRPSSGSVPHWRDVFQFVYMSHSYLIQLITACHAMLYAIVSCSFF